jgi:Ca2+-binding EF-hand superfamily protein
MTHSTLSYRVLLLGITIVGPIGYLFLVGMIGKNPTEKEMNAFFESCGPTQLSMDFASFKTAFGKPFKAPYDQDKDMRDAFKILDSDGDGTILESELRQMLLTIGEAMTHQEVDQLLQDITVDANGKVQYDKFVDMLVNGCPAGQDTF